MTSSNQKALAAALLAAFTLIGCGRNDNATTSTTGTGTSATTAGTTDTTSPSTSPSGVATGPVDATGTGTAGYANSSSTAGTASGVVGGTDTTGTTGTGMAGTSGTAGMTGAGTVASLNFDTLDINRDGMITQSELPADRSGGFAQYDTDGNQSLSRAELDSMATASNDTGSDQ